MFSTLNVWAVLRYSISWPCEAEIPPPQLASCCFHSVLRVEFLLFFFLLHWRQGALAVHDWGERYRLL